MTRDDSTPASLGAYATPLSSSALDDADASLGGAVVSGVTALDGGANEEVDVVGLGEATHGTREFFRAKAAVVRHLVRDCGFRTVAFEADVAAMDAVDAAVRRGERAPRAALAGLRKWMWQTEAVCDLVDWIRTFNEGRPPADRVRVRGVDLSDPGAPVDSLASYLGRVDPEYAERADDVATLRGYDSSAGDEGARKERLAAVETAADGVADRLESRREAYVEASSEAAWAEARHRCRVVEQTCEWHRVRFDHEGPHAAGMRERDRRMAENVAWSLERDPGEGVVVWAHNSHVQRGTFDDGQVWTDAPTMGEFLTREFGDRYVPVGFDFGRGAFRAMDATADGASGPSEFAVGDPHPESLTARFDSLSAAPCVVDVTRAGEDARLESALDRPRRIRWVGSVYDPNTPSEHYMRTRVPTAFDAVVFVPESTPTRPLGGG